MASLLGKIDSCYPKDKLLKFASMNAFVFTIDLCMHPKDCECFAFSIPSINFRESAHCYHWVVLPQGMANSPTMCQVYVATALQPLRKKYSQMYIIHYMDDILLTAREEKVLLAAYADLQYDLRQAGLIIAPEKVQKGISISIFRSSKKEFVHRN